MKNFIIVHNPRCSKSRCALELLESNGVSPQVVDYLNGGLTRDLLASIIKALGVHPKELLRTKEEEFQRLSIDINNDDQVIEAILKHPLLLERPIVINGQKAVIGRPPEKVLDLL